MEISTTLAIFAIVAVMGLVGVVAVTIMSVPENAEAAGCVDAVGKSGHGEPIIGYNASKGRCFR